jgi:hypothetical protein
LPETIRKALPELPLPRLWTLVTSAAGRVEGECWSVVDNGEIRSQRESIHSVNGTTLRTTPFHDWPLTVAAQNGLPKPNREAIFAYAQQIGPGGARREGSPLAASV